MLMGRLQRIVIGTVIVAFNVVAALGFVEGRIDSVYFHMKTS